MHVKFGDYHVSDIEFVAAFDVDAKKVGFDLSEAITASREQHDPDLRRAADRRRPCSAARPSTASASTTARRSRSPTTSRSTSSQVLKDTEADVLVSYLPVGSEEADKFYAQCAIDAGVGFVNALPVFIASDPEWAAKFEEAGVPIVGDDIKSQVGATITHRVMAKLFEDRGVVLDRTYQLNVGGNMDFKNMLERERLESKKISKTQAVTSNIDARPRARKNVHIGPSDYVAWLDDRKWAYVRLEGRAFGDVPLNLEYKLEVWDSPNSAGIIIDALRACKIAKDRGIGGPILSASTYLMKSPAGADGRRPRPRAGRGVHPRRGRALTCAVRRRSADARGRGPPLRGARPASGSRDGSMTPAILPTARASRLHSARMSDYPPSRTSPRRPGGPDTPPPPPPGAPAGAATTAATAGRRAGRAAPAAAPPAPRRSRWIRPPGGWARPHPGWIRTRARRAAVVPAARRPERLQRRQRVQLRLQEVQGEPAVRWS